MKNERVRGERRGGKSRKDERVRGQRKGEKRREEMRPPIAIWLLVESSVVVSETWFIRSFNK